MASCARPGYSPKSWNHFCQLKKKKRNPITPILTGILLTLTTTLSHGALFSEHDKQVDALLAQMTLDEKIGQMVQVDSGAIKDKADVQKYFLGSVLSGGS